jgi:hypothetical protein
VKLAAAFAAWTCRGTVDVSGAVTVMSENVLVAAAAQWAHQTIVVKRVSHSRTDHNGVACGTLGRGICALKSFKKRLVRSTCVILGNNLVAVNTFSRSSRSTGHPLPLLLLGPARSDYIKKLGTLCCWHPHGAPAVSTRP